MLRMHLFLIFSRAIRHAADMLKYELETEQQESLNINQKSLIFCCR